MKNELKFKNILLKNFFLFQTRENFNSSREDIQALMRKMLEVRQAVSKWVTQHQSKARFGEQVDPASLFEKLLPICELFVYEPIKKDPELFDSSPCEYLSKANLGWWYTVGAGIPNVF